ncbi:MAG: prolyl oligopeptidase family serine peptidase [Acidimicrobiales bacterium]
MRSARFSILALPLTVGEWEEWGNPAENEAIYQAMRAYAPYENVAAKPYPAIFAAAGLNDPRGELLGASQVGAALGEHSTSGRPILLWTDLESGHGGPSGRYDGWREEAKTLAFILRNVEALK